MSLPALPADACATQEAPLSTLADAVLHRVQKPPAIRTETSSSSHPHLSVEEINLLSPFLPLSPSTPSLPPPPPHNTLIDQFQHHNHHPFATHDPTPLFETVFQRSKPHKLHTLSPIPHVHPPHLPNFQPHPALNLSHKSHNSFPTPHSTTLNIPNDDLFTSFESPSLLSPPISPSQSAALHALQRRSGGPSRAFSRWRFRAINSSSHFQKVALPPPHARGKYARAVKLIDLHQDHLAFTLLSSIHDAHKWPAQLARAQCAARQGLMGDVMEAICEWIRTRRGVMRADYEAGICEEEIGIDESIDMTKLETVLLGDIGKGNRMDVWRAISFVRVANGDAKGGIGAARSAVATAGGGDARVWNWLGELLYGEGVYEEALRAFRSAVAIDGGCVRTWINVGKVYEEMNIFDCAVTYYLRAVDTAGDVEVEHVWVLVESCVRQIGQQVLIRLVKEKDLDSLCLYFAF